MGRDDRRAGRDALHNCRVDPGLHVVTNVDGAEHCIGAGFDGGAIARVGCRDECGQWSLAGSPAVGARRLGRDRRREAVASEQAGVDRIAVDVQGRFAAPDPAREWAQQQGHRRPHGTAPACGIPAASEAGTQTGCSCSPSRAATGPSRRPTWPRRASQRLARRDADKSIPGAARRTQESPRIAAGSWRRI